MMQNTIKTILSVFILGAILFIGCKKKNNPPDRPSPPSGLINGKADSIYSFSTRAIDQDGDSIAIRFDWDDGVTSDWSSNVASGQMVTMNHSWDSSGTYNIKTQAKDMKDATSNWSIGSQIIISTIYVEWTKTFGGLSIDAGSSVQQTEDGGYIIAGETFSFGAGSEDFYLIKTDGGGNQQWFKTFGGSDGEYCISVQQIKDRGFILVGFTQSFGAGMKDVYLIKTDANGNQQWVKTFGGLTTDQGYFVQQTSDGGYIIVGSTDSFGAGAGDVYLIKTDENGNQQWYKTFGGTLTDEGYSVQQTSDGGYIIAGYTMTALGVGKVDVYLIKTDENGNQQWYKTFGGDSSDDEGYSVQQTLDGGYIITGYTVSYGAGQDDVYLIKTDSDGNQQWYKTFGGTLNDEGYSVQQTLDGGYIITGYTVSYGAGQDDVYLIKTDSDGNQHWYKTFGGSYGDYGYSVQQTSDEGYIICGYTNSFGAGHGDVYLIKTDADGNTMKTFSFGQNRNNPNPPRSSSPKLLHDLKNTSGVGGR